LHAVALKGALLVSGSLALVSTSIHFIKDPDDGSATTHPASDVSGTPGTTIPLWTGLKRILWIWLGSALIVGPAVYIVETRMGDESQQFALQAAILVAAATAFFACWTKRPSA
jgi:hypothetical protein